MKKHILLLLVVLIITGCGAAVPMAQVPAPVVEEPAPDLSYLFEVALSGFEFGSAPPVVYKWTHDVTVSVEGAPGESDRAALTDVIHDLKELIAPLEVTLVPEGGDIVVFYGDDSEFSRRVDGYTPGNRGYFEVTYGSNFAIHGADILISTQVNAAARAHLLREELTQSFGFFQDSWADKESIFYQGWTTTADYAERDREIIRMLYDARIRPGMSRARVASVLGG